MKIIRLLKVSLIGVLILWPSISLAEFYHLPEMMVGQTKVFDETSGNTYYGGMTGNEVVLNYDPNFSELTGFNQSYLAPSSTGLSCYLMQLNQVPECYKITPSSNIIDIMTSRTSVNGSVGLETAVLLYPPKIVIGDVYSESYNFSDFYFFGRNLYKSGDRDSLDSNATWKEKDYTFNPKAQSSFSGEQQDYYLERIELLEGEADHSPSASLLRNTQTGWNLQNSTITSGLSKATLYPEGKVWYVDGDLSLKEGEYEYSGIGTIIVDGRLTMEREAKLLPKNSQSSLGIIVRGPVHLNGNNRLRAAVFAENMVYVNSDNIEVMGSVVAKNFTISGIKNGIRFFYDYNLENNWPPGFRYFNMPHPEEGM